MAVFLKFCFWKAHSTGQGAECTRCLFAESLRVCAYKYTSCTNPWKSELRQGNVGPSLQLFQPGNDKKALSGCLGIVRTALSAVTAPLPAAPGRKNTGLFWRVKAGSWYTGLTCHSFSFQLHHHYFVKPFKVPFASTP